MNTNSTKIIGFIFLLASGLFYTFERLSSVISTSIIKAGFFAGQQTGEVPDVKSAGLFDNLFVPLFFFIGLLLLIYKAQKKEK